MRRHFLLFPLLLLCGGFLGAQEQDFFRLCRAGSAGDIAAALVNDAKVKDRDGLGLTPLMYAAEFNPYPSALLVLIGAGAGVEDRDPNGITPLMRASRNPNPGEATRVLLDKGAEVRDRDRFGKTALHWAAANCPLPSVLDLLLKAGGELDALDEEGRSPLMLAAKYNGTAAVAALLEAGARAALRDKAGKTAYDYARENKKPLSPEVLAALRKAAGR